MPEAASVERTAAVLSGLTTMLLVLSVGLVVGGFVMPQPPNLPAYRSMAAPAAPVRLVVPSLRIDAPVVPVALSPGAVLDPPRDPQQVGWWSASARPGSPQGQTVITGHTVHTGGGAMDRIGRLHRGQFVEVVTRRGTMRYRVDRVRVLGKDRLAQRAVALFGQRHGAGRLVLVTCTGWNGSYYPSNVVVVGRPLGVPTHRHHGQHGHRDVRAAAAVG
ncbi:MAG TPA: class F sortase [Marmoricola sp.]|nr:class F sortase [Marmoricola sp.]